MRMGVAVLPVDEDGMAYLCREFRYAIGRESIEVAGGGIDQWESPLETGRREAREELGVEASEWIELGRIDPFTAVVHSLAHLFLARGLSFSPTERDGTEVMATLQVPLDEAVRLVMDGTITHGPSRVLILKAARF